MVQFVGPICLPNSIERESKCILTPNSPPIHENENYPNLSCRAYILKEAATSIKIHRIRHQNARTFYAPILLGRPRADKTSHSNKSTIHAPVKLGQQIVGSM